MRWPESRLCGPVRREWKRALRGWRPVTKLLPCFGVAGTRRLGENRGFFQERHAALAKIVRRKRKPGRSSERREIVMSNQPRPLRGMTIWVGLEEGWGCCLEFIPFSQKAGTASGERGLKFRTHQGPFSDARTLAATVSVTRKTAPKPPAGGTPCRSLPGQP